MLGEEVVNADLVERSLLQLVNVLDQETGSARRQAWSGKSRTFGGSREQASGWAPGTYPGVYQDGSPLARVIFPNWPRVMCPSPTPTEGGGPGVEAIPTKPGPPPGSPAR
jgi:hypothetical protein